MPKDLASISMTSEPLDGRSKPLARLRALQANGGDETENHIESDHLLLEWINDPEITEAFETIDKWYTLFGE